MEVTRLFDFIQYQKKHHPQEKAYGYKPDNEWVYFSTDEIIDMANQVSCGLLKLGVQPGDKVALSVYKNRPEWVIMDLGIQQLGGNTHGLGCIRHIGHHILLETGINLDGCVCL